jgi:UDP-3-O-[3-hydroxymyristoyl] glucosamine N-acyltransferase
MPDARFFTPEGPFTLNELSRLCGAEIANPSDGDRVFSNVAPLQDAGPDDLSFLDNKAYVDAFAATRAGCCVVAPEHAGRAPSGVALLVTKEPYLAYAQCASAYYPRTEDGYIPASAEENVHPSAEIGTGTLVAPGAVIGPSARVGENCRISPNAYIGEGVVIGDNCRVGPSASLRYCILGSNVILFAGVRIGEAGFGFARGPRGAVTVPQVGRVIIEDFVEIGANSTIDRGAGPDTVIGAGTRIDNLVQIGHNVSIGKGCIVVSQTGIAGSTQIGNGVQIGGQAGFAGHLSVGDGAMIAARTGVMKDIPPGVTVCGMPAVPIKQYFRQVALVSRLAKKKGK